MEYQLRIWVSLKVPSTDTEWMRTFPEVTLNSCDKRNLWPGNNKTYVIFDGELDKSRKVLRVDWNVGNLINASCRSTIALRC